MDFDPLGIFLVTTWTGGEKLLFRHPNEYEESPSKPNIVFSNNSYALKPSLVPQYSVCKESQLTNIKNGTVVGFDDCLLANLLISAKTNLCKRKYEIKVGDVIFVGFLHRMLRKKEFDPSSKKEQITFNIVFALHSSINGHYIPLYQDLSEKISLGLIHEEARTGYMSMQKQAILELHEIMQQNVPDKSSEKAYLSKIHERISIECSLGVFLRNVYENICEYGNVDLHLNDWIRISSIIAPKFPRCLVSYTNNNHRKRHPFFSKPSMLQEYLGEMRPYHSFLLLEDKRVVQNKLTVDCSPVLAKLLKLYTPLKSMDQLAAELDVALTHIRQIVCSLIVWGFAMVIYPVYDSNVYLLSPTANMSTNSSFQINFSLQFPNLFLPKVVSEFSTPFSFGHHRDSLVSPKDPGQETKVLVWLLQRQLVYQLHTYLYTLPSSVHDSPIGCHGNDIRGNSFLPNGPVLSINESLIPYRNVSSDMTGSTEDVSLFKSTEVLLNGRLDNSFSSASANIRTQIFAEGSELFERLSKTYFNGQYHLEAIMYRESISRSQLCHIIDRFRDKLYVFKHEEPSISYWVSSDN